MQEVLYAIFMLAQAITACSHESPKLYRDGDEKSFCYFDKDDKLVKSGVVVNGVEVFDKRPTLDRCPSMD